MKKLLTAPFGVRPVAPDLKEFQVNVAFTTRKGTLAALKEAARLTGGLHGRIRVIVPRIVPYPLDLQHPTVNQEFAEERFRDLSAKVGIDLQFEIVLCRETAHAYTVSLERNSLVIIGGRKRWWRTRETKLAALLTCEGHTVLFVNAEKENA